MGIVEEMERRKSPELLKWMQQQEQQQHKNDDDGKQKPQRPRRRLQLYHDRYPIQRGHKITKYKIKHRDVIEIKFFDDNDVDNNDDDKWQTTKSKKTTVQKNKLK